MADKIWFLIPELCLFLGVVVVFVMGLSKHRGVRDAVPAAAILFLLVAFIITPFLYTPEHVAPDHPLMPMLGKYVKMIVCGVGILLALLSVGMIDRRYEDSVQSGRVRFDPIRANRGEYFSFFLLSLIGVMLCCNANDLIWLFLALELTSLPTYVMVAMSRPSRKAQEASVKYMFLGAMAAAVMLYGFALLYGATGTIVLTEMRESFADQAASEAGIGIMGIIGMLLALLGAGFKIAAAPMHYYAADVYEGAAAPVTAFLAFVPKTAGMLAIMLLVSIMGWTATETGLPQPIMTMLWIVAIITMTLGNIGALLQRSVKRMLAYSSIAHSGYMLIGIIAGPALTGGRIDGLSAVLFYLLAYGIMNTAAFAVLSGLERNEQEIETLEDLAGLRVRYGLMAAVLSISAGSLLGFPPLLGFVGKLYLFVAGVQAGQIALVVIAGLNSAISAWYYLGLVKQSVMARPTPQSETVVRGRVVWPRLAGVLGGLALLVVPIFSQRLITEAEAVTGVAAGPGEAHAAISPADQLSTDGLPVREGVESR
ncbi:MAG: NADH-quinone oxidoreductase subunit N [Phycisphaerales bacterium]|nr:MAG: NADH-quinone oxidoreductase subunit N [Phycisphaerales bacterium]